MMSSYHTTLQISGRMVRQSRHARRNPNRVADEAEGSYQEREGPWLMPFPNRYNSTRTLIKHSTYKFAGQSPQTLLVGLLKLRRPVASSFTSTFADPSKLENHLQQRGDPGYFSRLGQASRKISSFKGENPNPSK